MDDLVAIEVAKHWALLGSETDSGASEAGTALRRLLKERADRVPALLEAAAVDVERYVLPPETAARYAGKQADVLDGSKGPLVKKADTLLQSVRLLVDKIAQPRPKPTFDVTIDGLV